MNDDNPSARLVDQRIRNRIMEALQTLADGDDGVRAVWPDEYFEQFYDWAPHHDDGVRTYDALTAEEDANLRIVSRLVDEGCDATPSIMTADEFIVTQWPKKIQPVAQQALLVMLKRGWFREDVEEEEPSLSNMARN